MKITTKRDEQPQPVTATIVIYIGEVRYRLSEVDEKLRVIKYNEGELEKDSEILIVFPRTGNEIELK